MRGEIQSKNGTLRLGTRGSALALAQTRQVAACLREAHPGLVVDEEVIRTRGDEIIDMALHEVGGKGVFVKELEDHLLDGRIDAAVHSLKDLPRDFPKGLVLGAVPVREEPWDVLVSQDGQSIRGLPPGSVIGTSSLRRKALLKRYRSDLKVVDIRGNVDTRLRKVSEGEVDGVILAAAGLNRLGIGERVVERLATEIMLPAVGQGALGIEIRAKDLRTAALLVPLNHIPTRQAITAERRVMAYLEGGCQVPVAAFAEIQGTRLRLKGLVVSLDGVRLVVAEEEGLPEEALLMGEKLARHLIELGADKILEDIRNV